MHHHTPSPTPFPTPSLLSFLFSFAFLAVSSFSASAQDRLMTRDGSVSFFSSTPVEDIEAHSEALVALLNPETGEIAFQVPIRSFHFEKALMEEHFNENYLESNKFPKATFTGTIKNWEAVKAGTATAIAEGTLNCHGIAVDRTVEGSLVNVEGTWALDAAFDIAPDAHEIAIPKLVRNKIAENISVRVRAELKAS